MARREFTASGSERRIDPPSADPAPSRRPDSPRTGTGPAKDAPTCDLCGTAMDERNCKILCPRCGYQRDCSDP